MSIATREQTVKGTHAARRFDTAVTAQWLEAAGRHTLRYGLVLVVLWIGGMKFTAYEAQGISGLVSNSPLMSWAYQMLGTRQFSALVGVAELAIAGLIAVRPWWPRLSVAGSVLAAGMFVSTISFLVTTPGVVEPSLGFPAISVVPGQFLLKDVVLLGAALLTAGEALRAAGRNATLAAAAVHGYDPVAYFTDGKPTPGRIEFTSTYGDQQYYFESASHKQMFDRDPDKYGPQYGGYCAFGVAAGELFDVDPQTGQVIDGKLYLNLNRKIQAEFNKDPAGHLEKADENWPTVRAAAGE